MELIKAADDDPSRARDIFERMLADESFTVSRAFKRLIEYMQDDLTDEAIRKLVEEKDLRGFLKFMSDYVDEFADELPKVFTRAARSEIERLSQPGLFGLGKLKVDFDPGAPSAAELMDASKLKLIREFTANQRDAVRTAISDSLKEGKGPAASAKAFRDAIGLTRNQVQAIKNYQSLLERGSAQALDRQLRDGRFDRTVARVIGNDDVLSSKQIERMVARYTQNMRNYRAMTIARTETMRVLNQAKQESWRQMADQLGIDPDDVERTWITQLDGRERDTHHDMNRQTVIGIDTPFESPSGAELLYPGDPSAPAEETIQCRCTTIVKFILPIKKAGFDPNEPRDSDGKWTADGSTKEDKKKKIKEELDERVRFESGFRLGEDDEANRRAYALDELAEELDNKNITADEFVGGLFPGKLRDKPKVFIRGNKGDRKFQFKALFGDGDVPEGKVERTLDFKNKVVHHDYLSLEKTGTGRAKEILGSQVALYEKLGFEEVHTNANIDVGGYAWPKYGFLPDENEWHENLKPDLKNTMMEKLSMKLSGDEYSAMKKLVSSDDRRSVWAIADSEYGKKLLMNTDWNGTLDLQDVESMNRFHTYISKGSK